MTQIHFIDDPVFSSELGTFEDNVLYRRDLESGTASWNVLENGTWLNFICPCGCHSAHSIHVYQGQQLGDKGYGWWWNGNREQPSLHPSLRFTKCGWHGHLNQGQFFRDPN